MHRYINLIIPVSILIFIFGSMIYIGYSDYQYNKSSNFANRLMKESGMTIDDLHYIDTGKIFKYDGAYYIRTSDGTILSIDWRDANEAYNNK